MKEQIKNIIESYCEGINHLEFNIADLDKMADEILALQLQQTGVVWRSEQLKAYAEFLQTRQDFQERSNKDLAIDYCDSL